jgi:hypothetical protein
MLADLIKDEIQDKFYVCNIEGQLHDIQWDDPWGDDSDDESLPPLMGRQPSSDSDNSDSYNSGFGDLYYKGWRPSYLDSDDSKDNEPQRKSYHAERRWTCFPTTRSKSREEPTPPVKKDPPRPKKSKRTQWKSKAVKEHEPRPQDKSDPDSDPDDSKVQERFNNRAKAAQSLEPNEESGERITGIKPRLHTPSKKDVEEYSKYFPGTDIDTLRKTFDATTQYGSKGATQGHTLRNQIASPNPILNLPRRRCPILGTQRGLWGADCWDRTTSTHTI